MKHDQHATSGQDQGAANKGLSHRMRRWFLFNSVLSGIFALLWLILRSGNKPSRFAYPCQQAAFGTATAAFGVPLVATILSARRSLMTAYATKTGRLVTACGLVVTLTFGAWAFSRPPAGFNRGPRLEPSGSYRAEVFVRNRCPQNPIGQNFPGLDDLITWMGVHGEKFYQSDTTENFVAGPEGLIAIDDTVVIKINYQWPDRGGTNTDVLNGLIRRIVDHPDGFDGEVVVCENSQFNSINNFDRANNNAQNHALSPHDVVVEYQDQGYTVSHYDWTVRRNTQVQEYSTGNMTDGYVVGPYNGTLHGRVTYPKFQSSYGTYISIKYGLWDTGSSTYDRGHLKFINAPVLKSHHATYGATACVKHYMGVVTDGLGSSSHSAIYWGIMGGLLGDIQLADLNLLDCIWINANPYDGPWTSYAAATRMDQLVASMDPVAADIWAVKNILIPAFLANGYSPPWPYPSADPDNPNSHFRIYLDNSMDQILAAGYDVTNNLAQIDAYEHDGRVGWMGDINGDFVYDMNDVPLFVGVMLGSNTDPIHMLRSDMNGDLIVNGADIEPFLGVLLP